MIGRAVCETSDGQRNKAGKNRVEHVPMSASNNIYVHIPHKILDPVPMHVRELPCSSLAEWWWFDSSFEHQCDPDTIAHEVGGWKKCVEAR